MGKEKHLKDVENLFKKSLVVNAKSIKAIVNKKRNIKQYAKQLIRNLILKGKIKRITQGFYTSRDDISLAVFCFKPSYLGLQDALSFHNLWEQETIPIIITSRKIRSGIRTVNTGNVLIRRIAKKYLFGFDYYPQQGIAAPYSDIEKTLIDMIYFKERMNREVLHVINQKIDRKKLKSYLKFYPKRIQKRVFKLIS